MKTEPAAIAWLRGEPVVIERSFRWVAATDARGRILWAHRSDVQEFLDVAVASDVLVAILGDAAGPVRERVIGLALDSGAPTKLDVRGGVGLWAATDPRRAEVVVGDLRSTVVLDARSGRALTSWPGVEAFHGALHRRVVVATDYEVVHVLDRDAGAVRSFERPGSGDAAIVALDAPGTIAALAWTDGTVERLDVATDEIVRVGHLPPDARWIGALGPARIAVETGDSIVLLETAAAHDHPYRDPVRRDAPWHAIRLGGRGPIALDGEGRLWGMRDGAPAIVLAQR